MTDPMVDIAALAARVLAAAVDWRRGHFSDSETSAPDEMDLCAAVDAFQAACEPRSLTWGTVPAGWEVRAPDGRWYRVIATHRADPWQMVTMDGIDARRRDPEGPVTARPSATNPTDVALAALGFPEILEDKL